MLPLILAARPHPRGASTHGWSERAHHVDRDVPGIDPLYDMDFIDLSIIDPHLPGRDLTHLGLVHDGPVRDDPAIVGHPRGHWA